MSAFQDWRISAKYDYLFFWRFCAKILIGTIVHRKDKAYDCFRVGGRENYFHCGTCDMCLPNHLHQVPFLSLFQWLEQFQTPPNKLMTHVTCSSNVLLLSGAQMCWEGLQVKLPCLPGNCYSHLCHILPGIPMGCKFTPLGPWILILMDCIPCFRKTSTPAESHHRFLLATT